MAELINNRIFELMNQGITGVMATMQVIKEYQLTDAVLCGDAIVAWYKQYS